MRKPRARWAINFLLLVVPGLFAASLPAQYNSQGGGSDDPPGTIARIGYLQGGVSLQASGSDDWSQAPVNYPMVAGDRLYTGGGSRAVVQLGGAELRIWQQTDVSLVNQTDNFQQIGLASGNLRLRVFEMYPGSQIEVDTPNGAVIVESPGDYRIEAFPQNGSSIVTVSNGNVDITGPGVNQPVASGYSVGLFGSNPVELQYLDVPDYDDLDYWSFERDRRQENSISARYVSRHMVGYSDLDGNGTWNPNTEYGPVWYPNNVPDGWRPYSTGHWAYVQPWGYTWVDDASWGFAPFHYGRWTQIDGRWGWTPGPPQDRPVYSPALVAFVGGGPGGGRDERGGGGGGLSINIGFGGGGGIAAWFPIGVGEPYVPWYRCSPSYARQVNTSNVNVAVIRNTTIVNNYNTYINKTVINNTTVNNTTINNRTVNNTTVNNFNYANRGQVTAVPAAALSSGSSVTRQAVQLSPQQRQQIAAAPIALRPPAPAPATPHPSLAPAPQAVARPAAARPILMTPTGQARAVPTAVKPQPVVVAKLPPPRIVPRTPPPSPAAPRPVPVNRPAAGSAPVPTTPVVLRPAAPVNRPAAAQPVVAAPRPEAPAPINRAAPGIQGGHAEPAPVNRAAPVSRPEPEPGQLKPAPVGPTQPRNPPPAAQGPPMQQPVQRPQPAQRPAPVPQPAPVQQAPQRPAPVPAPVQRPTPLPPPAQQPQPARPTPPAAERQAPAPVTRPMPAPRPNPQPPVEQNRPAPIRPAPAPAQIPQQPAPARPQPTPPTQQNVKPAARPAPTRPEDKSKDDAKQNRPN